MGKSGSEFFRPKRSKIFVRHFDDGNPLKTPCSGTHPQNLLKVSNFGGAPIGGSLIGFGNKLVAVGAPKEKINLASPIP